MGAPARVVQVSDPHLSRRHGFFVGNWHRVVRRLAAAPPDLVVDTGDLTVNGADDDDDLAYAVEQHRRLPSPWLALPGNHDVGEEPGALVVGQPVDRARIDRWTRWCGADRWVVDRAGWRLVGLNCFLYGSGLPAEEEQQVWLAEALRTTEGPVGVFVHKPLFLASTDEEPEPEWSIAPVHRDALLALFGAAPVRFVASGHLHQSRRSAWHGIEMLWAPSCGFPSPEARPGASTHLGWIEYELDGEDWRATEVAVPELVRHDTRPLKGDHRFLHQAPPFPPPADDAGGG